MKLPGIGEVKPVYVWVGGGSIVLILLYARAKSKGAASATATDTSGTDTTGTDYQDPSALAAGYYGGYDPNTGVPYYVEQSSAQTQSTYTSNASWENDALTYAVNDYGATEALAQRALADYLTGKKGLPANEYDVVSYVVALLGPPPVGSFSLSEAPPPLGGGNPPSGGGPTPTGGTLRAGEKITVPWKVQAGQSLQSIAARFGISPEHLQQINGGKAWAPGAIFNIQYDVQPTDSLTSLAKLFELAPAHLQQYL